MHANHAEQGTMYVVSLDHSTLNRLLDRLQNAGHARLAIEVRPDAIPLGTGQDIYVGDLKVSADSGVWSPPLSTVCIREAAMFDAPARA